MKRFKLPKLPYLFEDEESLENAFAAYHHPDRPSAFLISANGTGAGKSAFARACIARSTFVDADRIACARWPDGERAKAEVIYESARRGYLFLDNAPDRALRSVELLSFLCRHGSMLHRLRGSTRMVDIANSTLTFITGNFFSLSVDVRRRVRIINMVSPFCDPFKI